MTSTPVLRLVHEGTPADKLKRQFKGSLKADRKQMGHRFLRRLGAAAVTGAAAYGAIRHGAPAALRRVEAFEVGQRAGAAALGLKTVARTLAAKIPGVRHLMSSAKTDATTEAFAKRAIGISASGYAKQGISKASANRGKIAAGAAGAHIALGSIHDARKTRKDQNKLARRLLTL